MEIRSATLSANGARLAYGTRSFSSDYWRLPVLADRLATWADAERITSSQGKVQFARLTPDQRSLMVSLYRPGNYDIWRLPLDGGAMERLTTHPGYDYGPAVSADGEDLVFYSTRGGDSNIWLLPLAGGPIRQLTNGSYPVWSPDGREIVFTSNGTLKRCVVDSCEPVSLTDTFACLADWSPDGDWLACAHDGRVWRLPASGGDPEPVTPTLDGVGPVVRWAAGGSEVWFPGRISGKFAIWAVNVEDGTERALADLTGRNGWMDPYSFAAGGDFFYFSWGEGTGDIWVVDLVD
jgi:Tol biopolymer transport system component